MDKNLYRTLCWHLLYNESLLEVAKTCDINIDEDILKLFVLQLSQMEKILDNTLPAGGGSTFVLSAARNCIFSCLFIRNVRFQMRNVQIVNRCHAIGFCG